MKTFKQYLKEDILNNPIIITISGRTNESVKDHNEWVDKNTSSGLEHIYDLRRVLFPNNIKKFADIDMVLTEIQYKESKDGNWIRGTQEWNDKDVILINGKKFHKLLDFK